MHDSHDGQQRVRVETLQATNLVAALRAHLDPGRTLGQGGLDSGRALGQVGLDPGRAPGQGGSSEY